MTKTEANEVYMVAQAEYAGICAEEAAIYPKRDRELTKRANVAHEARRVAFMAWVHAA